MPSDRPLLTIAIPTFERAEYLRELLLSIHRQLIHHPNVELLVSDNASSDETPEVVKNLSKFVHNLKYIRNDMDIGPDRNFLKCYEEAAGRYVWIVGDDDLILDGGLSIIIDVLEREAPEYVFIAPDVFRESVTEIRQKKRIVPTQLIGTSIEMANLVNLHADLIFISAAIVDKDRIISLSHPPFASLIGTGIIQLGWVLTSLRHLRRGLFVQRGVLAARGGNSRGGFQAARVFGEFYQRALSQMLEPNSKLFAKLVGDHLKIWFPRNWLSFRVEGIDHRDQSAVIRKAFSGTPSYWICAWPLMYLPLPLARFWAKVLWMVVRARIECLSITVKPVSRPPLTEMPNR